MLWFFEAVIGFVCCFIVLGFFAAIFGFIGLVTAPIIMVMIAINTKIADLLFRSKYKKYTRGYREYTLGNEDEFENVSRNRISRVSSENDLWYQLLGDTEKKKQFWE
jgi:hypothetical protein